jgi:ribosome maturation factor RimP
VASETEALRSYAEPIARRHDLDLVDVEVKGGGGRRLVRIVVDRKGGVDLTSCRSISEELSRELDAADPDPVAGSYSLEVTSPGTSRPLRDQAAFDRVEGREVLIHRARDDEPPVQVSGTVLAAHEDAVELEVDGDAEPVRVPYAEVVKATQKLPW